MEEEEADRSTHKIELSSVTDLIALHILGTLRHSRCLPYNEFLQPPPSLERTANHFPENLLITLNLVRGPN